MVVMSKAYFYFHLTRTGWVSTLSDEEIVFDNEKTPYGSMLMLKVTEYSHAERPDVWHRAEIVDMCQLEDKAELQKCFEHFSLPKLVEDKCWIQILQLKQSIAQ